MARHQLEFLPPFIARRGASARAPENTCAAFEAARHDGVHWIGINVKLTADGVPVVIHDEILDRTTDGHGIVSDMAWQDISKLDAGSWFAPEFKETPVPTLAQVLDFAVQTDTRLELELRPSPGRAQATTMIAMMEIAKAWKNTPAPVLISSFDIDALQVAAQMHADMPRALFVDLWRDDWRELATLTKASAIGINETLLTPERLKVMHAAHAPILAYTVNDPDRARDLLAAGVQALFTDNPREMMRKLAF